MPGLHSENRVQHLSLVCINKARLDPSTAPVQVQKNLRISGYLFRYIPLAGGLFSSPWENHFVTLTGTMLSYSKYACSAGGPCTRVSVEVCSLPALP